MRIAVAIVLAIGVANAQNPGNEKTNLNPGLSMEICTGNQQCQQGMIIQPVDLTFHLVFFFKTNSVTVN